MFRLCAAIVAFIVLITSVGAIQQSASPPQFRTAVNYVEVPVRVTDSAGSFVPGLKALDFEVSEAGRPQTIVTFDETHRETPAPSGRNAPPQASRAGAALRTPQAVFVIVIDDPHLSAESTPRAQTALRQLVERQLQPQDLIGITYTSGAQGQDLTADRALLRAAIERLHGSYDPRLPKANQEALAQTAIRTVSDVVKALQRYATQQPTALVLVTAGIGCVVAPRASDVSIVLCGSTLSDAVKQAVSNGVAIYSTDLGGSVNPHYVSPAAFSDVSPDMFREGAAAPSVNGTEPPRGSENMADAMRVLAEETGGFAFFNSDNLTPALARVVDAGSSSYRIGYASNNDRTPEKIGTNIVVRVRRPGLHVFYARQRSRPAVSPLGAGTLANPTTAVKSNDSANDLPAVLARVDSYIGRWKSAFASVLMEEQRSQQVWRLGSGLEPKQATAANLLLFRQTSCTAMVTFRDVYEVNGRPVRDHDERLRKLFAESSSTAPDDAATIANESSRYNIGTTLRNIDVPTFGFLVLAGECQPRFRFTRGKDDEVDGQRVWRIKYQERARPTIVRTLRNEPVPIEGTVWIEPGSGRVVRTLVKTEGTSDTLGSLRMTTPRLATGSTQLWLQVTFGPDPSMDVWVPRLMEEVIVGTDQSLTRAEATYGRVRRFDVGTTETFVPR